MKLDLALELTFAGAVACGGATKTPETSVNPVQEQAAGSRMQDDTVGVNLVPPGYGTLRQDDVSIKIQYEGIQVLGEGDEPGLERLRLFIDPGDGLLDRVLRTVREHKGDLRHVSLTPPSLEDVYIHLTGRELRD